MEHDGLVDHGAHYEGTEGKDDGGEEAVALMTDVADMPAEKDVEGGGARFAERVAREMHVKPQKGCVLRFSMQRPFMRRFRITRMWKHPRRGEGQRLMVSAKRNRDASKHKMYECFQEGKTYMCDRSVTVTTCSQNTRVQLSS